MNVFSNGKTGIFPMGMKRQPTGEMKNGNVEKWRYCTCFQLGGPSWQPRETGRLQWQKGFYCTTIREPTPQDARSRPVASEMRGQRYRTSESLRWGSAPTVRTRQKKFDNKHSLAFPLLSDPDHKVAELYGAKGEKKHGLFDG